MVVSWLAGPEGPAFFCTPFLSAKRLLSWSCVPTCQRAFAIADAKIRTQKSQVQKWLPFWVMFAVLGDFCNWGHPALP